jgi:ribosomal protein S15P/S13E
LIGERLAVLTSNFVTLTPHVERGHSDRIHERCLQARVARLPPRNEDGAVHVR